MSVTRDDVARRAGVSTATVSYVINNSRSVGEATRRRVLAAVEELGYEPNIVARSLASNKTWQLAIAVADIANPFFGEIVLGFQEAAQEHGYFVNIISATQNLDAYLSHLIARRIDGIFVAALPTRFNTGLLYELVDSGIAVVVSGNRTVDGRRVSSIENDYDAAMEEAFRILTRLGHRRIAYLSGLPRNLRFDNRAAAYRRCVEAYGIGTGDELLFEIPGSYDTSLEDGKLLAQKFLSAEAGIRAPGTAVICTNAMMALGAHAVIRGSGYRIPDDVSLLAFDNIFAEELIDPPLSCFDMQKREFGRRAFDLLNTQLLDGTRSHLKNALSYVGRESVGPAPS